ncbi:M18 family aminopeptidase [Marinospirillum alkaliphilum]|uniref:M18 family aminopeptidase n=1 Tax=Marinospirillum alkaliphilum DSM 21637 TaxID=1122209 RepID=A0A1K1TDQ6_9GAMM|nr:M18 family aminopeptidase [Marinospirillum alkaliphilum]SFW98783.1 aspartyl aminopeptidase [Marinospirillum alkaliphilum DSM 21637]
MTQQQAVFNQGLISFLQASPTPAHAVENMVRQLQEAGFSPLHEGESWVLEPGQGYFLVRGGRSLLAFRLGQQPVVEAGVCMMGAHTDSPCLKVKPNPELVRQGYLQLGVEVYGGVLMHPWFDRDLSLAGQVYFRNEAGQLQQALVDLGEPVAVIPSLAIHLNREANKSSEVNAQLHLPPVLGAAESAVDGEVAEPALKRLLASWLKREGHQVAEVVDFDLCFYDTQPPALVGLEQSFISSARLDNLLSCYVGLQALLATDQGQAATSLLVCNDHEEVGSASAIGAEGPFLESVLRRLSGDEQQYQRMIARSLLVSCDNAHAVHPNYADKHDENHGPKMNAGPVIKLNANQRYATSSETAALFAGFCATAGVPVQRFVVRSDMGCGSTIGPIAATRLGVRVVDVGAPQWAMHSIRETAGTQDAWYLCQALQAFITGWTGQE